LAAPAEQPAACLAGAELASLSGTWQAEALAHVPGGVAPSRQRLQLQVGSDGRVIGQRDWAAVFIGPGAVQGRDRQGQASFTDVQPMIGWIEPRSCRVLLVETEDAGRVSGWLRRQVGGPVLELEISQSGRGAVVVMAVFRQLPASPRVPGRR
jgi:hypothetical protein